MAAEPRPLIIVGAGGCARETAELVAQLNSVRPVYRLLGFLDDDPAKQGVRIDGIPVLGPVRDIREAVNNTPGTQIVVCTGSPRDFGSRRRIVSAAGLPPDAYATLVHPDTRLPSSARVGAGTVLGAAVVLTAAVQVGLHVCVMPQVVLTHDNRIGDFVTIGAGVRLAGGVQVGDGAYLGAGCLVRENVTIGAGALVGMGSVVVGDVGAGQVWVGPTGTAGRLTPGSSRSALNERVGTSTEQAIHPTEWRQSG